MKPEDVPAELVDRGYAAMLDAGYRVVEDIGDQVPEDQAVRRVLAAVLPEVRYAAKVDAVTEARMVISQYLATAEKWRYDRVMWAFAIMLGEIPEDTPAPESPADARLRAARLTARDRCDGGCVNPGSGDCPTCKAAATEGPTDG